MKDSKTPDRGQDHSIFKHRKTGHRLFIAPVVAAMIATLASCVSPQNLLAQTGWNSEQDSCSSLYPSTTPNDFEDFSFNPPRWIMEPPPPGWGNPMQDASGHEAHWSWDGVHPIVSCNTLGLYATFDGTESRSHSSLLSNGYGAAFQCVELAQRYAYARWGDLPTAWSGDASSHYFNHPSHLTPHDNGTTYVPAKGDIVVFGPVDSTLKPDPSAGPGHIAVISNVDLTAKTVQVFEQNWATTLGFHTLDLYETSSGGSTLYTIGNNHGLASTLQIDSGGHPHAYRFDTSHYIYGVLTDNTGSSSQTDPRPPTGTQSCSAAVGPFITSYCDGPAVKINCGGAIGSQNDFSGIPINWTYTNGSTACDIVTYNFGFMNTARTCSFYLYVPNGFATSTIKATLSDGTQHSFNENPVSGWQHWFDATDITSLTFTDANGTTSQQLGWGRTSSWSIERLCNF